MSTQYTASWCFFHSLCKYCARRGTFKSIFSRSLCSLFLGSISTKEYCLSLAWILTSKYQSIVDERMKIKRTSDVVNMMKESALNFHIVLQCRINEITSWLSLMSSEINICSWKHQCNTDISFVLLLLLPSILFHRLSDQCIDCANWL